MTNPKNLIELYSGNDLSLLFKGDFINFGYWENISEVISENDLVTANKNLYHQVFQRLNLNNEDKVLEVGSGHGGGCVFLSSSYSIKSIIGVDYLPLHTDYSKKKYSSLTELGKLKFIEGAAESIPLPDETIDKIYTIEAFQHFNPQKAIPEFSRVLSPNGKLVISTFFSENKNYFAELLTLIPKPALLSDNGGIEFAALPEVLNLLDKHSFQAIQVENISQYVWAGYDKWVKQNNPSIWDTNWQVAYDRGLMNYYIITATLVK